MREEPPLYAAKCFLALVRRVIGTMWAQETECRIGRVNVCKWKAQHLGGGRKLTGELVGEGKEKCCTSKLSG